jgi:hypothetical protein
VKSLLLWLTLLLLLAFGKTSISMIKSLTNSKLFPKMTANPRLKKPNLSLRKEANLRKRRHN